MYGNACVTGKFYRKYFQCCNLVWGLQSNDLDCFVNMYMYIVSIRHGHSLPVHFFYSLLEGFVNFFIHVNVLKVVVCFSPHVHVCQDNITCCNLLSIVDFHNSHHLLS